MGVGGGIRPKGLRVFTYLLGIRYWDVIVLQGPPLMGVAFESGGTGSLTSASSWWPTCSW